MCDMGGKALQSFLPYAVLNVYAVKKTCTLSNNHLRLCCVAFGNCIVNLLEEVCNSGSENYENRDNSGCDKSDDQAIFYHALTVFIL